MDASVKSHSRLGVSVSFGRFENDTLSWEKWSSFSPNKNLEEVGSLSTPGSVAQKKAYFEAHYKKIAARKAEELEQDDPMGHVLSIDVPNIKDNHENSSGSDAKFVSCNGEKYYDETALETCGIALTNRTMVDEANDKDLRSMAVVKQAVSTNGLMNVATLSKEKGATSAAVESQISMDQEAKEELNVYKADQELIVIKEASLVEEETPPLVEEETPPMKSQEIEEHPPERKNAAEKLTALKKENSKFNARNVSSKVTTTKMERNLAGSKKKVVSPIANPLHDSNPKYSKLQVSSAPISTSLTGKKKLSKSPQPKSKNEMVIESRRATATSLHMSLSLQHTNSSAAFGMTRKSLIMEKIGDKHIVKRAFKSFQKQINGSPAEEKSFSLKQVSSTSFETKMSRSPTPRKENTGSHTSYGLDKRNTIAVSPSIGLQSDEKSEKRKQFLKKLEAKSITREAENIQLNERSKEEKESEIRKLRQTLNFKASPMPPFYRGQGHGHLEMEDVSNKTTRHRTRSSNRST